MTISRLGRMLRTMAKVVARVMLGTLAATLGVVALARAAGYSTVVVQGRSMGSSAPMGSLAVMEAVDAADVDVRDVVMLRRGDSAGAMPVLHRVVEVDRVSGHVIVVTQGDANRAPDHAPQVLGDSVPRMRTFIPYLGRYLTLLMTPAGWAVGVVGPATVLTAWTLLRLWPRAVVARTPLQEAGAGR